MSTLRPTTSGTRHLLFILDTWCLPGEENSTGGTLYNYRLIEALRERYRISLCSFHGGKKPLEGVACTFLNDPRRVKGAGMFVWKRELERILRQHHTTVDAVITTTSANGALSLAKAHGLRTASIVQAYEDFGWQVPNGTALERLAGMRRRWSTGRFTGSGLDAADVVIANSTFMARAIRERVTSRPKMQVLYPPLDLPMQRRATKWGPARSVGFVNRAGKNLPFVLELARKLPGLAFNVFGTVPAPQSSFPRNLVLRGWEANRHSMYGSSDTWIVPSSWEEPFGLVAIESLSQGCRLAVSRRGGLPEAAGPHGRIFERLDVNEWAMWLQAPASSPIESAERDLSAHLEQFALQTFVKRGHEMFEEWL